ncbi:MAG: hypothetical protein ACKVVT_00055 [Dehalococcoidia bacterium]
MPVSEWRRFDAYEVAKLPPSPGVFELADAEGRVLFIGIAGTKTRGGLKAALTKELQAPGEAYQFRYEPTPRYLPREQELLTAYAVANGGLPPVNRARARKRAGLPPK